MASAIQYTTKVHKSSGGQAPPTTTWVLSLWNDASLKNEVFYLSSASFPSGSLYCTIQ
ncbi:hypothetical protein KFK09_010187 [Dendrobium nobile]|uniref:Uncharacterized protein n=1 Tax=Dendrobium nobile TaxID=94219 RepID=A0A8T3BNN8_DENNO|nr:hypothetical protein KFK09_010187 [Dendrobium nobile]